MTVVRNSYFTIPYSFEWTSRLGHALATRLRVYTFPWLCIEGQAVEVALDIKGEAMISHRNVITKSDNERFLPSPSNRDLDGLSRRRLEGTPELSAP